MTTTRKPTNCYDCGRKLTSSNRSDVNDDLCTKCADYAADENWHSDDAHDETGPVEGCRVCAGAVPTNDQKAGHSNGIAKTHTSHAACDHASTKAARAACRKARAAQA